MWWITIPATGGGYRFVPDGTADEDVASADDPTYQWKKNSGQNLLFVVKNAFDDSETADKLLAVLVDGQEIDSSHYTAAEGSLRLTLKAAYLQTLSVGTHTLTVRFTDGTVSHTFTVLPAPAGSDSPVTGESAIALAVSAILLALAAAGAAYVIYGVIQKASKGDTSAAKFLCELAKEKPEPTFSTNGGVKYVMNSDGYDAISSIV